MNFNLYSLLLVVFCYAECFDVSQWDVLIVWNKQTSQCYVVSINGEYLCQRYVITVMGFWLTLLRGGVWYMDRLGWLNLPDDSLVWKVCTVIFLHLTGLTIHWSCDSLFWRTISPAAHWSYDPLFLGSVPLVLLIWNISPYISLVLPLPGPMPCWCDAPTDLRDLSPGDAWLIGPMNHLSYNPIVRRFTGQSLVLRPICPMFHLSYRLEPKCYATHSQYLCIFRMCGLWNNEMLIFLLNIFISKVGDCFVTQI